MSHIEDTTHAAAASIASKGTVAGAGFGTLGWLASDRWVALGGLFVAVLGFIVNALFRLLDRRDKRNQMRRNEERIKEEDARAKELHQIKLKVLHKSLAAGQANVDDALDAAEKVSS